MATREYLRGGSLALCILYLVLVKTAQATQPYQCYTCDDIQTSEDCLNVTTCLPNEICYIRADGYNTGGVLHSLGCTGSDLNIAGEHTFCVETCQNDYCNIKGCQLPVSPLGNHERSPRCLSCDLVNSPEDCTNLVQCSDNEVCFSRAVDIYGKVQYRLGCVHKQHCSDSPDQGPSATIVGRRDISDSCSICCSTDFCNAQDCHTQLNNGTMDQLNMLGDNMTCSDSDPAVCSAFGLLQKDACSALHYVDQKCPKTCGLCGHFGWSEWGSWSTCSATCSSGVNTRTRSCLHQIAAVSQLNCTGRTTDSRVCSTNIPCDVEGTWSAWEAWGACPSNGGNGTKTRQRYCKSTTLQHGNLYCVGDNIEEAVCTELISHGGSSYYFSVMLTTFSAALKICHDRHSTLVHIDSSSENTFVYNHMKTLKNDAEDIWIGMTDAKQEGIWILTDTNKQASYTNWRVGEPSNSGDLLVEDCAVVTGKNVYHLKWNDVACEHATGHIVCEK